VVNTRVFEKVRARRAAWRTLPGQVHAAAGQTRLTWERSRRNALKKNVVFPAVRADDANQLPALKVALTASTAVNPLKRTVTARAFSNSTPPRFG
jgi:hypothetical protein